MHHPAAAEITVEARGLRLTLRAESSPEDYARQLEGQPPVAADHEYADLLAEALAAALPQLLQARRRVDASLSVAWITLLQEQVEQSNPEGKA